MFFVLVIYVFLTLMYLKHSIETSKQIINNGNENKYQRKEEAMKELKFKVKIELQRTSEKVKHPVNHSTYNSSI